MEFHMHSGSRTAPPFTIANGTFVSIIKEELPDDARVVRSRFIYHLKNAEHGMHRKTLLVTQNYANQEAKGIAIKARPSTYYLSDLFFAWCPFKVMKAFSRDTT